jgi:flagellar biosynthesis protein FlhB
MVALGLVDYVCRLARHRQRLRMTHEEARREHKETEGNPERKMERQRLHRELHSQAEPFDVGQARLLLVDPGRAAVAVAWTDGGEEPPVLIVRGEGLRARAIESVAHATGVPVTLDPALVRGLAGVSEGSAIPEVWYGALARAGARGRGGGASRVTDARMAGSTAAPTPGGARG